jgi:hypothetical protein
MVCLYLGASPPIGESVRTPRQASRAPLAPEQQWHPYLFPLRRCHEVLDRLSGDLASLALMEEEERAKQGNQSESLSLLCSGGTRTSLFTVLMRASGEGVASCGGAGLGQVGCPIWTSITHTHTQIYHCNHRNFENDLIY